VFVKFFLRTSGWVVKGVGIGLLIWLFGEIMVYKQYFR